MRSVAIAAAVGVLLILPACGGSSAPQQTTTAPTELPGFVDCGAGTPRVKPPDLLTRCSDGDFHITGIRWSAWSSQGATGKGTGHLECGTACVPGDPEKFPIHIELSEPTTCSAKTGPQFMLLALRIIGRKPTHTGRDLSYHSNCPSS